MRTSWLRFGSGSNCKMCCFFLAFIWCLSLGLGSLFAYLTQPVTVSLMCVAPRCQVSIVGLVIILLFPLLLSAVAVVFSVPGIIYPLALLDGVAYGYFLLGSVLTFGSSAWLIGLMLSFSKLTFVVPSLSFAILCFSDRKASVSSLMNRIFAAVIIGAFDYLIVSPFLLSIMFE